MNGIPSAPESTVASSGATQLRPYCHSNTAVTQAFEFPRRSSGRFLRSYSLYKRKPAQQVVLLSAFFFVGIVVSAVLLITTRKVAPSLIFAPSINQESDETSAIEQTLSVPPTISRAPEIEPLELKPTTKAAAAQDQEAPQRIVSEPETLPPTSKAPVASNAQEPVAATSETIIKYPLQRGDTLLKVWTKQGLPITGALKVAEVLKVAEIPFTGLKPGDELVLKKNSDGDIKELSFSLKTGQTVTLTGSAKEGYQLKVLSPLRETKERRVSGSISHSFALAAQSQAVPVSLVDELADLFGSKFDFRRDIQVGDSYTIFFSETRSKDGALLDVGPVTAASFEVSGKLYAAVRHENSAGKPVYFDQDGKLFGSLFLRYPVQYSRISSVFSEARFHPVLKVHRPHLGVDFAAPVGTPVRAIGDGLVQISGPRGGAGNMVRIVHGDRYSSDYLHLSKIGKGIRNGTHVARGQVIGSVGQSGLATGPHLHFALFDRGSFVNPLKAKLDYESPTNEGLPAEVLQVQLALLRDAHAQLAIAQSKSSAPRG